MAACSGRNADDIGWRRRSSDWRARACAARRTARTDDGSGRQPFTATACTAALRCATEARVTASTPGPARAPGGYDGSVNAYHANVALGRTLQQFATAPNFTELPTQLDVITPNNDGGYNTTNRL